MTQFQSHEIRVLLINGTVVHFTLRELSQFIRSKSMVGFVLVFLVGIVAGNPVLFPTMPEVRLRAIYWSLSVAVYLLFLPLYIRLEWSLWTRFTSKPIPHILATVPFVMPQALLGMYLWSKFLFPEPMGSPAEIVWTMVANTALAHFAELAALIWLLPAYREANRKADPAAQTPPDPEPQFVVLNGRSVPLASIRSARSAEHYLILTTDQRTIDLRARMKDFLEQVSDRDGVQIHRSIWVAAWEAQELHGQSVRTASGERLPVSRGRMQEVRAWFERQGKPH